ncbi:MAG: flagellar M-ring protein FliF, partial [Caulobacterales bacterium]|nr:flagellar M-ring protein FliF [Caulobacterales bacterium]
MRLIIMFGVTAGVAAALSLVAFNVGGSEKTTLYSDMRLSEVPDITQRLEQAGIGYELAAGGSTIRVDRDRVTDARVMLSAEGLPSAASLGYELFDEQSAMGQTQFQQNLNKVRALEGELARTIQAIDGVSSARVHLALPERRLFDRAGSEPKASVWVELRQGDLATRHARSIRNLVAGAVPDLTPARVTILDGQGRLLASGAEDDPEAAASFAMEDRRSAMEEQLRRRVVDMIEGLLGPGAVRAQVTVDADFNRVTEQEETYDPDGQVVRSTQVVDEQLSESENDSDGGVTVAENVPDGDGAGQVEATLSESATSRTQEIINYEISRRTRTAVHEVGAITRLSVAVAVDGTTTVDEAGEATYTPRTDEEMARITTLVQRAVGFDEARGDALEVVNVRFARTLPDAAGTGAPAPLALDKNDLMRGAELLVLLVVALMVIFLVARPLMKGALGGPAAASAGALPAAAAAAGGAAVP